MSEQQETPRQSDATLAKVRGLSPGALIGLGAAIAAVPAGYGGYHLYRHFEKTAAANDRALAKAFDYDLTELKKVDPALVKYQELSRIETAMQSPRAIAVDAAGNLLVAGDRLVRRFNTTGGFTDLISLNAAPFCLAVAADGSVLVGLKDHVEVFSTDGKPKAVWGSFGARSYLTCITVSGASVWVADAGRRVVMRCGMDGKVFQEIGKPDNAHRYEGFVVPSPHLDVAVGADGLAWVANPGMHRFEAYNADGQFQRQWGAAGTGIEEFFGCCNPTDFAMLSDGSFVTAEKGIARIKRYRADGHFDCVVAPPSAFSDNVEGLDLAAGPDGRIMVLERGAKSIRVFAPAAGGAS